jgi:ElaB/YqjD/DUF883 family membrane-anchored ribosome-binding protein
MSDAATPANGAAPKTRKVVRKVKAEARSFAADADEAREKLIATAIQRARARRELVRRWAEEQAGVAGEAVQTRPMTAIVAAFGVGLIVGLLAGR